MREDKRKLHWKISLLKQNFRVLIEKMAQNKYFISRYIHRKVRLKWQKYGKEK